MGTIIYSDTESSSGWAFGGVRFNPNRQFKKHLDNYYYLRFIAERSDSFGERHQANKELAICERKLDYWKRDREFSLETAMRDHAEIKKNWQGSVERGYAL